MRVLTLEDFAAIASADPGASGAAPIATAATDDAGLDVFENGYRNGWDDCLAAESEAQHRIGSDLAANLQDAVLVYAEARQDVLRALDPLFEQVIAQLLPRLAAEAVAPALLAELSELATKATETGPVIFAAPQSCPPLSRLLERHCQTMPEVKPEPAFAEGQVSIRFGTTRRDIDMAAAAEAMAQAIRDFLDDTNNPIGRGAAA